MTLSPTYCWASGGVLPGTRRLIARFTELGEFGYLQDEWRLSPRLTLNYGLRYEVNTPFSDVRGRLNAFVPGQQSTVFSNAPKGLLFPGDAGIGDGIAPVFWKGLMPRLGFAWNPDGHASFVVRGSYGIFFDPMTNGSGTTSQAPVSALPWTQLNQISGPNTGFSDPYGTAPKPAPLSFIKPASVVALDSNARPPYAQNWNLSLQKALGKNYLLEGRYLGTKGTHLPRNIEANPAVFGPGATSSNADRRRIYANCPADGSPCDFTHVAMLSYITNPLITQLNSR